MGTIPIGRAGLQNESLALRCTRHRAGCICQWRHTLDAAIQRRKSIIRCVVALRVRSHLVQIRSSRLCGEHVNIVYVHGTVGVEDVGQSFCRVGGKGRNAVTDSRGIWEVACHILASIGTTCSDKVVCIAVIDNFCCWDYEHLCAGVGV